MFEKLGMITKHLSETKDEIGTHLKQTCQTINDVDAIKRAQILTELRTYLDRADGYVFGLLSSFHLEAKLSQSEPILKAFQKSMDGEIAVLTKAIAQPRRKFEYHKLITNILSAYNELIYTVFGLTDVVAKQQDFTQPQTVFFYAQLKADYYEGMNDTQIFGDEEDRDRERYVLVNDVVETFRFLAKATTSKQRNTR